MASTEELHRMLDERGIEWYEAGGVTFFGASDYGTRYAASEPECGITLDPLTPEQVIATTIGREACGGEFHRSSDLSSGRIPIYYCKSTNKSIFMEHTAAYCPLCGGRVVE